MWWTANQSLIIIFRYSFCYCFRKSVYIYILNLCSCDFVGTYWMDWFKFLRSFNSFWKNSKIWAESIVCTFFHVEFIEIYFYFYFPGKSIHTQFLPWWGLNRKRKKSLKTLLCYIKVATSQEVSLFSSHLQKIRLNT